MNIFITGASNGLGKEIALHFLKKGENVFGFSLNEFDNNDNSFKGFILGNKFMHMRGSLTDIEQFNSAIEKSYNTFGVIDVLINNAGIKHHKFPDQISDTEYLNVINTNLTYQILLTQAVLRRMIKNKRGVIINIASRAGMEYYDTGTAYCSSKAGLIAYSLSLSKYLKRFNIGVNVISPKTISTKDYKFLKPELNHKIFIKVNTILNILDYIIYNKKLISGKNFPVFNLKSYSRYLLLTLMKCFEYLMQIRIR